MSTTEWILLGVAAFSVGLSKMGLSAVVLLIIPILASVFGAKTSTGLLLPMLIVGDIMAVVHYRKHIDVKAISRLLIWVCIGIGLGLAAGNYVDDALFKTLLAISVILCMGALVFSEIRGKRFTPPNKIWFYALVGILGGITTMIGNAAGPIMSIYLFSMGYQKERFIGTSAWFFFIVNILKLPLQTFVWHNIQTDTLLHALIMVPVVVLGAVAGSWIVKKINEKLFRYFIIAMTLIAAVVLLV